MPHQDTLPSVSLKLGGESPGPNGLGPYCRTPPAIGPATSAIHRASGILLSRELRSSEGRLLFLFAHYQNRAVCVSDDAIGYTPHQRSSYSGAAAAAYYYQTRSYLLG